MILKAGTYRFNDVLTPIDNSSNSEYFLDFICQEYVCKSMVLDITYSAIEPFELSHFLLTFYLADNDFGVTVYSYSVDSVDNGWNVYPELGVTSILNTITFVTDQTVDYNFGTWFISNTNYNEVNAKPLAEITYNGETIAQLNAGETATLPCKDLAMASDVVVKVNKVESKIPEGYVKPEGTLEITLNNIETEYPIDCSQYAKVTVNTAEPLKISDPTVLDNITNSPWGVGGSVFLYEGATTDSYENGALYYLEDTEK